jgi:hypothetical protein
MKTLDIMAYINLVSTPLVTALLQLVRVILGK